MADPIDPPAPASTSTSVPLTWQVGQVRIDRVEENIVPLPTKVLVPDMTVEHLEHNRSWLAPYFEPSTDDGPGNELMLRLSLHSFVVRSGGTTMVVDTCVGPDPERSLPGDPAFLARLERVIDGGLSAVDLVICTHVHFDHVGWNTVERDGRVVPTFENARYLITAAEMAELDGDDHMGVRDPSVQPLIDAGVLDIIDLDDDGRYRLTDEVSLLSTPGHTAGHVSVLIESDGQSALITGDAFHSPIQFSNPELAAWRFDTDPELSTATRQALVERFVGSDALILGTHFAPPTGGRLHHGPDGVWFGTEAVLPIETGPEVEGESGHVRRQVREWLAANWNPPSPDQRPAGWLETVVDSGWAAPSWPTDRHGRGLSPELGRVVEAEFRAVGAPGTGQDMANLWANTVLAHGSDELKDRFVRPLMLGQVKMCLLYSEPGAGSDLAGIQTSAVRDGDEWIINGQKVWTSGGRQAEYAMLIVRTDWDVPKHRGISFFFFPMDQPGVEVRALRQATGDSRFNEVFLTDARVPHANMLGGHNEGWRVLQTALAYERVAMGQSQARAAGRGTAADGRVEAERSADDERPAPAPDLSLLDLARDVDRHREPVMRQKLMRLHAMRQVNEWNGQRAKAELENGTSSSTASFGKLAMSGILHYAGSLQTELLGAEGTIGGAASPRSVDATYSLLNAFFTSIGGGTDQIQRNIIGERILGLPKEPAVDRDLPFREVRRAT